jgi:hypothetical protein
MIIAAWIIATGDGVVTRHGATIHTLLHVWTTIISLRAVVAVET